MCICCNDNKVKKTFSIKNRGYGSQFDLINREFALCKNCIKLTKIEDEWFTEKPNKNGEYKHEKEIIKFIIDYVDEHLFE